MKPRMSSLNPYAASYIPLYWREENKKSKMSELTAEGSLKSAHKNNDSYSPSEFHEQSLAFAYSVSGGDTEASIDMLNELESNPADDSKYLPDSLDIGDVPECKVTAACSSSKLSFLSDEASGTSSGPSGSAT
ncbi:hypothetical protein CFOL_v3_29685 [Cephalotus follicularis]|uniref:Uncharacterized protein n=1 Tax=Cephalotus follicularis TaxID=3775 RepID=A0A1Q3D1D6_CEPFO|nr:hypothetical protein CFOL_v3_29685 [Cephalotus follicularis]